jgi:hypothetical protein
MKGIMPFHRATIVILATLFTVAMTSVTSACCALVAAGGTNSPNPVPIAPAPIYVGPWSGGWSLTPWSFGAGWAGWSGSGGCGCCGCRVAPSPVYVVDRGPDYTGPGVMVPFLTYTPTIGFPYVSGCCRYGAARQTPLVRKASSGSDENKGSLSLRQAQRMLGHP